MSGNLRNELKDSILLFLKGRFALDDNAHQYEVEANIRRSVEFRGQNLWILMFAIIVASVGLNVNSAAVIIGAMLISPLMGPIMGFGLSLGIYDFELLKRSLRNLVFAAIVSVIVSSVYFAITPLTEAQPELLARTSPSIWDVLIAFFGGLAGMVAQTRKDRTTTVIPGVAIATALMPPLCTAGYGLGTLQFEYFIGALYLFTINAVLITVATYLVIRYLNYERKQQVDSLLERKIRNYIFVIMVVTIVPSVILGYNIVRRTIFETNAKEFVSSAFNFEQSQVIDSKFTLKHGEKEIEVLVIGKELSNDVITALNNSKDNFKLSDAKLTIKQQPSGSGNGVANSQTIDKLYSVSNRFLDEKDRKIKELEEKLEELSIDNIDTKSIAREFLAISGNKISIAPSKVVYYDSEGVVADTVLVCIVKQSGDDVKEMSSEDRSRITHWLRERTKVDNVEIIEVKNREKLENAKNSEESDVQ